MRETIEKRCNLFIENRNIMKSAFKWESAYIYPLCAWIYASKDKEADIELLQHCFGLLKKKTSIFSNFRGTSEMATVTMLSLSPNPEEKMELTLTIYEKLKKLFWGSEYLAVTAATLADCAEPSECEQIVERTRMIYNQMKAAHPFLTSGEDSTFAALLALSGLDAEHIEGETTKCYKILKSEFFSGNAVQSLSHVLALGDGSAEQKCQKVLDLYRYLKKNKYKYRTSYELATLGVLALLDTDIETLGKDIMEVDDFLKTQKGFGSFGIGGRQRLMYAGMLTMCDYVPNVQTMQTAALNGIIALVIAQQVAIYASIAAASASSSSSNSSS